MDSLEKLAHHLGAVCLQKGLIVATAESCTGGWVSQALTEIPGSSQWFDCGYVTYSNGAKRRVLGVQDRTLEAFGAVSEETVEEMAQGALQSGDANLAVAISGIAGPDGGTEAKPVGTVWFAWASNGRVLHTALCHFEGNRHGIREQAVRRALLGLIQCAEHIEAL